MNNHVHNDEDMLEVLIIPNVLGLNQIVLRSLAVSEYEKQRNNAEYEPIINFAICLDEDGAKRIGEALISCAQVFENNAKRGGK
jgi:hypothetical protein